MNAIDVLTRIQRSFSRRLRAREYRRLLQGAHGEPRVRAWFTWESAKTLMSLPALASLLLVLWYFATVPDARLTEERKLAALANVYRPVEQDSPVFEMASALAVRGWDLVQCDRAPTRYAAAHEGYRVLLRYTFKTEEETGGGWVLLTKRMHMDLVFFPSANVAFDGIKQSIHWEDVEQRRPAWLDVEGPVHAYDLGQTNGYRVFGRMTIPQQEFVRRTLVLKGGDDPYALIESRLAQCADHGSYWRTLRLLKGCGPEALPLIQRTLEAGRFGSRTWLMGILFEMPGEESWRLLHAYYQQPEMRARVARILSEQDCDPRWKDAYLRMIDGDPSASYVTVGLDAAAAFSWDESLPSIARVMAAPHSIGHYVAACKAERQIRGNPVSPELEEAADKIRIADEFRRVRNVHLDLGPPGRDHIIQCGDEEGAILTAIEIAASQLSASFLASENTGISILLQLPREKVLTTLRHLASATQNQDSRADAREILEAVLNGGERAQT
ncbi:MAG: hypothetical protein IT364_21365 [Candidatus Hydrogenedentes bacterium]|nr:hypothetical protein [Candidatus Hydrogenedentota bacterium]